MIGVYITILPDHDLSRGGITNKYSAWGGQAHVNAADWLHREQRIHNRAWQFNKRVILPSRMMRERDRKPTQLMLWIPAPDTGLTPPPGYYPQKIGA